MHKIQRLRAECRPKFGRRQRTVTLWQPAATRSVLLRSDAPGSLRSLPTDLTAGLTQLTWKADKPEAEEAVPEVGIVPTAVCRPAVGGIQVPRAAAQDPGRPFFHVHTPFPNVPRHVMAAIGADAV